MWWKPDRGPGPQGTRHSDLLFTSTTDLAVVLEGSHYKCHAVAIDDRRDKKRPTIRTHSCSAIHQAHQVTVSH